jgi:hypothetical protein
MIRTLLSRLVASIRTPLDVRKRFTDVYRGNAFGGTVSRSGGGSDLQQTAALRVELPGLLRALGVRTLLDAPCGDLYWISMVELGIDKYIGVDIVEELVESNRLRFPGPSREFRCLDLINDPLPRADLILCRDCLVHLNFAQALRVLQNFRRSGATYLLTTTFLRRSRNADLVGNDLWRTLNLELAPFRFPAPLRVLDEKCTEGDGNYADKSLGLWRLVDIPVS